MDIQSTKTLNNGVKIPMLGLGVYKIPDGDPVVRAIHWALDAGYRHIDTAAIYGNEKGVGRALREGEIPREEIFVTTKLWNNDHDRAVEALDESLKKLGLEKVDLWLMHWPVEKKRLDTWKMMEDMYHQGLCRAIGVSNFTIRHLEELLEVCHVKPAVNQVEYHPYLFQRELRNFCHSTGIALEAYSPLIKGDMDRIENPAVVEIAEKYDKTPAQILIRWALEQDVIVIPKSSNRERIEENSQVFDFEISDEDMETLKGLNEDYHCTWDPSEIR